MISLSDNEIDQVYDVLIERGLTFETLRDELLDHICCIIEEQMELGAKFHTALTNAEKQFGPSGIERTQEATIHLLTLKLRKMKKTASILGIIGGVTTILGTLFKVMHWPFAGVLLLSGLAFTALLFMPTALYVNYKSKEGIKDRATIAAGFTGWFILTIFALLKVMHWPGASIMLMFGLGEIILIFIPLYYVRSYRNAENKWFDIGSLTVILAGIIMVLTLYSAGGPNTYYSNLTRNQEVVGINAYQQLKSKVNAQSTALKSAKTDLATKIELLDQSTYLVTNVFWEYRNELLTDNYEKNRVTIDKTIAQLESQNIAEYESWTRLKKIGIDIYDGDKDLSGLKIGSFLSEYQKLVKTIFPNANGFNKQFSQLIVAFNSLPTPSTLQEDNYLLHINFINSLEFELKKYQKSILDNV